MERDILSPPEKGGYLPLDVVGEGIFGVSHAHYGALEIGVCLYVCEVKEGKNWGIRIPQLAHVTL